MKMLIFSAAFATIISSLPAHAELSEKMEELLINPSARDQLSHKMTMGNGGGSYDNPVAGGIITMDTPDIFQDITGAYQNEFPPNAKQVIEMLKPNPTKEINGPFKDNFETVKEQYQKEFPIGSPFDQKDPLPPLKDPEMPPYYGPEQDFSYKGDDVYILPYILLERESQIQ